MNIKRILPLVIAVLTMQVSCVNDADKNTTEETEIGIELPDKENLVNLSEIVDSVSFVPLATNDSCRIGSVDKLIVMDKCFIVVDKSSAASVFVFDKSGRFLNKIGDRGHSNKEYLRLEDVAVNGNKVYILDSKGKKVICYDISGKYIENYPLGFIAYYFNYVSDGLFAFSCEYTKNSELAVDNKLPNFLLYDFAEKKVINADLYFDSSTSSEAFPVSLNNLNPYLYHTFSDSIYKVTAHGLSPFIHIAYPQEYAEQIKMYSEKASNKELTINDLEKHMEKMPQLISFFDCEDVYFMFIANGGKLYYNLYYPQTHKLLQAMGKGCIPIVDDLYNGLIIMPQTAFKGNLYYAENIKNISGNKRFSNATGDENPVIVELFMKK